jgi:dihydrofolate reductase (trimethoprim resistance protein)
MQSDKTFSTIIEYTAFQYGDRVRKKGSKGQWHGHIVGIYSASCTPIGYAVESEREEGSVQIYPESALEYYEGS